VRASGAAIDALKDDAELKTCVTTVIQTDVEESVGSTHYGDADFWRQSAAHRINDPSVDSGMAMRKVGLCLLKAKAYSQAQAIFAHLVNGYEGGFIHPSFPSAGQYYQGLALADEGLGDKVAAAKAIKTAWELPSDLEHSSFFDDYKRLNRAEWTRIAAEKAKESRSRWAAYSPDERDTIQINGGSRDNIDPGLPCHVETYDGSGNYHQATWWYCDSDGKRTEAYTFLNGYLKSHYVP
jgi:tetratricopeptide (TPR) repeat protein